MLLTLTITDTLPFRIWNFFNYCSIAEYSTEECGKGRKGRREGERKKGRQGVDRKTLKERNRKTTG